MGKKSIRKNKNIYQIKREAAELTRDAASERMETISADRIEKIESEKSAPRPEEILAMSDCYKTPELNNYFCSHECPIGRHYVPEVPMRDLANITLQMINSLNMMGKQKDRLIEIASDGEITDSEIEDFLIIQQELEKISITVEALQLWVEKTIDDGKLDMEKVKEIKERLEKREDK